ncbi:MAG: L-threonylcarbamoyladenylate synthase [Spirulinaceae cyanobacterium]
MVRVSQTELIAGAIAGQLVSFPTDTLPALAVRPEQAELIFKAKQRPHHKPLILMGASLEELLPYIAGSAAQLNIWQQVAKQHWPGGLTLVLPASEAVPQAMNPQDHTTIGIRVPNQPFAQEILAATKPLATTSANLSGQPALTTMDAVEATFPEVLTWEYPDLENNANLFSGVASTVAKWTDTGWEILRQGAVYLELNNS